MLFPPTAARLLTEPAKPIRPVYDTPPAIVYTRHWPRVLSFVSRLLHRDGAGSVAVVDGTAAELVALSGRRDCSGVPSAEAVTELAS